MRTTVNAMDSLARSYGARYHEHCATFTEAARWGDRQVAVLALQYPAKGTGWHSLRDGSWTNHDADLNAAMERAFK